MRLQSSAALQAYLLNDSYTYAAYVSLCRKLPFKFHFNQQQDHQDRPHLLYLQHQVHKFVKPSRGGGFVLVNDNFKLKIKGYDQKMRVSMGTDNTHPS